jgi:hypothetical protein
MILSTLGDSKMNAIIQERDDATKNCIADILTASLLGASTVP